ncbi:cell death-inducing p53-target protein 1-like [Brevipalpus obovatus]|uniref:cell death-inducing p53-target protein 1-like n=1 Tax=Brevipalpus obovatus TaxID=246614 RepID=UPI003D9E3BDC
MSSEKGQIITMNRIANDSTSQVNTQFATAASQTNYGPYSVLVICPGCNQQVPTRIKMKIGLATWLTCMICPVLGCLPFLFDWGKDVAHECSGCNRKLGYFKRL